MQQVNTDNLSQSQSENDINKKTYFKASFVIRQISKIALPLIATVGSTIILVSSLAAIPILAFQAICIGTVATAAICFVYGVVRSVKKVISILREKHDDRTRETIEEEIKEKKSFRQEIGEIVQEAVNNMKAGRNPINSSEII